MLRVIGGRGRGPSDFVMGRVERGLRRRERLSRRGSQDRSEFPKQPGAPVRSELGGGELAPVPDGGRGACGSLASGRLGPC